MRISNKTFMPLVGTTKDGKGFKACACRPAGAGRGQGPQGGVKGVDVKPLEPSNP